MSAPRGGTRLALLLIPALWALLALPYSARRRRAGGAVPVTSPRRRRRILTRLLAAIGVTFVLGMIPPLRSMLVVHLFLVNTFLGYVTLLVHRSNRRSRCPTAPAPADAPAPPPPVDGRAHADDVKLRYVPALDGLRAVAVAAVFAYHAGLDWARGGFLGVDVFFVLSGYLITALLVREWRTAGRIDLRRFMRRRARRLLPALVALLVAVSVAVPLLAPDQAYRLRGDVLAALGYLTNWRLIFENQSYFQAMGRPPLLQHLWSLAVEGQFYLVWPLVLFVLLRRVDARHLVWPIVALAAGSSALMALLYQPGIDPSRLYYGTDTRAAALLIGAALACRPPRWRADARMAFRRRAALELTSAAAVAGLAVCVVAVSEFDAGLYRGGFLGVAVLAAVLVALAGHPRGALAAVLGSRPLVWLGRRSYAVYLWFWPVMMLTRPHSDIDLTGTPLLALRIAVTLFLAALSYRFVERPVRSGAVGRVVAARRDGGARPSPRRSRTRWALVMAVTVGALGSAVVVPYRPQPTPSFALPLPAIGDLAPLAQVGTGPGPSPTAADAATTTVPPGPVATPAAADAAATPAATPVAALPTTARVSAIGESVLLDAKASLERQLEGVVVDAVIGRQFPESLAAARKIRDDGRLGDTVIVQLGSNGVVPAGQFDELLEVLGDVRVLVVTIKVPRPWQAPNNEVFASAARRRPNVVLVDWHAVGAAHPEAFEDDGVHLTPAGLRLYLQLLLSKL